MGIVVLLADEVWLLISVFLHVVVVFLVRSRFNAVYVVELGPPHMSIDGGTAPMLEESLVVVLIVVW